MSTKIMLLRMIDDMLILVYQSALLSLQHIVFNPLQVEELTHSSKC